MRVRHRVADLNNFFYRYKYLVSSFLAYILLRFGYRSRSDHDQDPGPNFFMIQWHGSGNINFYRNPDPLLTHYCRNSDPNLDMTDRGIRDKDLDLARRTCQEDPDLAGGGSGSSGKEDPDLEGRGSGSSGQRIRTQLAEDPDLVGKGSGSSGQRIRIRSTVLAVGLQINYITRQLFQYKHHYETNIANIISLKKA